VRHLERICVVTGGSRGIGESIVRKFASQGAKVLFTYRHEKEIALQLVKEVEQLGYHCACYQMDVTSRSSVEKFEASVSMKYNHIDVLINNAGVNKPEDFDKILDEDWNAVLDVNLKGPYIVSQVLLPLLKLSTSASIVNIGSVSGQYGGPRTAHYAASKAGLISLSQVIARYGAEYGIRCNTISAGLIQSEMAAVGMASPVVAKAAESILLKRFGKQSEIADVVSFLASTESSYITAQTINVNGGLYF
jgi:3-oxoacyl-[acyl-carrier protein] reductase